MQRFTNILYVHDPGSRTSTAFERAKVLARRNGARLTLVTVVSELPRTLPNLEKSIYEFHDRQLKSLIPRATSSGLEVDTRVLVGTPFLEIIHAAIKGRHDLVIKAAGGRGGTSNMLFGSTDLHLLRKCPCPVWIVKPSKRKHYNRIMAAVDPYHTDREGVELNRLILDLATSMAEMDGSELHIVHAWHLVYEPFLRSSRARVPKSQIEREVRETRKIHKRLLDELVGNFDLSGITSKVHLLKGKPGDVIPSVANKKRVELIVMGTVARTGIAGLIIGNTAEKTLAQVDCSVLALKPSSFATPVKV